MTLMVQKDSPVVSTKFAFANEIQAKEFFDFASNEAGLATSFAIVHISTRFVSVWSDDGDGPRWYERFSAGAKP